jgi:23S rRNA (cytosine1962-C5)-methyltransferase
VSVPRITLKRGKARPLWAGHPWIFSGAIDRIDGDPDESGLAEVFDDQGQRIGTGTFNPEARIAVRMLGNISDGWLRRRVEAARALRKQWGLPTGDTTAYRLLNGEGDGTPGLICDIFGEMASVQVTTASAENWANELRDILTERIVRIMVPEDSARMEGIAPGDRLGRGDHEEHVELREHGIEWRLKPGKGQKTGFYTDQRDSRFKMRGLGAGKRVLDAYCYTGGFGLNAARGGATEVVGCDSSGPAISVAAGTAKANGLGQTTYHKEDAIRYMRGIGEATFDIVVIDPPKLARRRAGLDDAYKKYRAINVEAMKHVEPGGILVSCSCSGLVDTEMFTRMLTDAAMHADRRLTLLELAGPGADHPTPLAFTEGRYLKTAFLRVY